MRKTWAKITALAAACALAVSMTGCGSSSGSSESSTSGSSAAESGSTAAAVDTSEGGTVTVGLLHSLTGSMAISEGSVRDAEVLAIEEINADGGVLGRQIEYIEEDGASEPSTFATKAEKLLGEDEVSTVFGCWTSSSRKAVKQIFEDYDNLLWYPVQYEGMESSENIVYMGAAPNQQIVPAIEYLLEQGYSRFFLIGSDYVFPRTANMIINAQIEAADGAEVVGEEYAAMDQTEFSSIITKIEEAKPDVIINTLNGTGNVSFFKQLADRNISSDDIMSMSFSIAEEEVATIGADILKGNLVSWNYYQTTDTEKNKEFVAAYKAKFGEDRVTSDPAEAAYDAVYMWKAACEKAGSFDTDAVRAALDGLSIEAPEGTITVNGENQHISKPVRIGQVAEDGLIYEVSATDSPVEPDPYLTSYDWAVAAGVQPIE